MAPVAVQSIWSMRAASGDDGTPVDLPLPKGPDGLVSDDAIRERFAHNLNSCHVWAEDGETIAAVKRGRGARGAAVDPRSLREARDRPGDMAGAVPRVTISGMPADRATTDGDALSVALVGPGAVGLVVASALVDAGRRPVIAARTPFRRIVHESGVETYRADDGTDIDVVTDPGEVAEPVDLVFVATKIPQTPAAAPWFEALCGPGTVVAGLQNGIDHRDRLSSWVPRRDVAPVVVNLPAERLAPGEVRSGGRPNLTVPDDAAGQRVAAALAGSFLPVRPLGPQEFCDASWTKLLINSSLGVLGVLTGAPNGIITDPDARWLFRALVNEAALVGRAEGAELPDDIADRLHERIVGGAPDHRSSIAVDRRAGRPTEWRARNQIVVELAAKHGIEVPLNRAGATLIRLGEPASGE